MAISSYGAATDSSGVVRILKDLDINIEGRHVLVVEDIIDSGLTLSYLMRNLESRRACLARGCALMTKPARSEIDVARALGRIRDPEPVRDRLRARLRGAIQEPALRRRTERGPDPRRGVTKPLSSTVRRMRCLLPWRKKPREPILPQRTLPSGRHRSARLPGEPDADPAQGDEEDPLSRQLFTQIQATRGSRITSSSTRASSQIGCDAARTARSSRSTTRATRRSSSSRTARRRRASTTTRRASAARPGGRSSPRSSRSCSCSASGSS